MTDLDLVEAWELWLSNVQVNQHTLYGWSILALGRAGKLVSFVAGMTVVLDIIGPERIREFTNRFKQINVARHRISTDVADWVKIVLVLLALAIAYRLTEIMSGVHVSITEIVLHLAMFAVAFALPVTIWFLITLLIKGFESPRWERVLRWGALALLAVGFHFDMLAS
ncbi:hypothetical protein [Nonomuraea dietziae]|uniref:hypothetical protein n=1 Tax=Nonomuraea dietziae TaxID=65515 RepID=UPI003433583F